MTAFALDTRLEVENSEEITVILNGVLADLGDLRSQLDFAHWNTKGPHFLQLHELFEKVNDSFDEIYDELAERITTLGGTAQGTVRQAAQSSRLREIGVEESPYLDAITELTSVFANQVRKDIKTVGDLEDELSADLLTELGRLTDKNVWLLESHLR